MVKAIIKQVGPKAVNGKDPLVILFGKDAGEDLQEVSVIQEFMDDKQNIRLEVGKTLKIGSQEFTITFVGDLAQANLEKIDHTTLYFKECGATPRVNGVYLTPATVPSFEVGETICYPE